MSPELIAALGLLVAIAAVFYQARSYHLSRRDLTLKVENLTELVHRLEIESAERKKLAEEQSRLLVNDLTQHAEALNHATRISNIHQSTAELFARSMYGALADIQYVLFAHSRALTTKEPATTADTLRAAEALCAARLAHLALAHDWNEESLQITDAMSVPCTTVDAAKERVRFATQSTAFLDGKYTDNMMELNTNVIDARRILLTLLKTE